MAAAKLKASAKEQARLSRFAASRRLAGLPAEPNPTGGRVDRRPASLGQALKQIAAELAALPADPRAGGFRHGHSDAPPPPPRPLPPPPPPRPLPPPPPPQEIEHVCLACGRVWKDEDIQNASGSSTSLCRAAALSAQLADPNTAPVALYTGAGAGGIASALEVKGFSGGSGPWQRCLQEHGLPVELATRPAVQQLCRAPVLARLLSIQPAVWAADHRGRGPASKVKAVGDSLKPAGGKQHVGKGAGGGTAAVVGPDELEEGGVEAEFLSSSPAMIIELNRLFELAVALENEAEADDRPPPIEADHIQARAAWASIAAGRKVTATTSTLLSF